MQVLLWWSQDETYGKPPRNDVTPFLALCLAMQNISGLETVMDSISLSLSIVDMSPWPPPRKRHREIDARMAPNLSA